MWQPNADDPYHPGPFFGNLSIHGQMEEIGDVQTDNSTVDSYYHQGPFFENPSVHGTMEGIGGVQTNNSTAEGFHSEFQSNSPAIHSASESDWINALEDWPPGAPGNIELEGSEPTSAQLDPINNADLPGNWHPGINPGVAAPRPFTSVIVDGVLDEQFIKYLDSLGAPALKLLVMDLSNVAWNYSFTHTIARMPTRLVSNNLVTETCERQLSIDPARLLEEGMHIVYTLFFSFLF